MTIQFYYNKSDDKRVNKTLEKVGDVITGKLLTENAVITLTIGFNKNIPVNANYAYITEFGRYYFIRDITINANNLITVTFYVDVLMSYKDEILASTGRTSAGKTYNPYAPNAVPIDSRTNIKVISFNNPFSETKNNILITVRG